MPKALSKDRILGIIMLVVSLIFAYMTTGIKVTNIVGDPGPRLFPLIGCFVTGLCSIVLIIKKSGEEDKPYMTGEQWKRFWIVFGIYIINYLAMYIFGYKVSIPLTLLLSCLLFAKGSGVPLWKKLLYVAAVTAALILVYVVLLQAVLPLGKLGL